MWPWASYLESLSSKNCALLLEDHFYLDDGWKGGETEAGKHYQVQATVDEGLDLPYLGCTPEKRLQKLSD